MSIWLRKRLAVWVGVSLLGSALLWNGGALRAQSGSGPSVYVAKARKTPRIKLTQEKAAKSFVALLQSYDVETRSVSRNTEIDAAMLSSFSSKNERDFGEALEPLLIKMAVQWKQPQYRVKVQSEGEKTATVTVEADPSQTPRPLILIQEGDSWGVDVVETYAKWNGLEGIAKTEAVVRLSKELNQARENARRNSCQSNLKQIGLGIRMYFQDYDYKLPPAKTWIDATMPYLKSEQIFKCPSVTDARGYGYAYNSRLSNQSEIALNGPDKTVSLYETTILKRNAYGMGENRAFRHFDGANYAFVDGRIKWFPKTQTPSFKLKP